MWAGAAPSLIKIAPCITTVLKVLNQGVKKTNPKKTIEEIPWENKYTKVSPLFWLKDLKANNPKNLNIFNSIKAQTIKTLPEESPRIAVKKSKKTKGAEKKTIIK